MAELPAISVVLPYRNARQWLAQTIVSLAAERDFNFELVAINDHSSDGSDELLSRLTQGWPRQSMQSLHGSGLGVSAARNLGIQAARAPVVAFLDADDRYLPGRLRQPWELLQRQPELGHVHGGWQRIDGRGQFICAVEPWREGAAFNWNAALQHKAVLPSAWTVRRAALLELGGFDQSLSHAEDVDLMVRLAAAGHKGIWLQQPLCRYRVHSQSASAQLPLLCEQLPAVVERHLQQLEDPQHPWAEGVRYGTISWCSWKCWSQGESARALQLLQRALAHCPLPLPRRPVHFLEHMARSSRREGLPFDRQGLLASGFWQQANALLLQP